MSSLKQKLPKMVRKGERNSWGAGGREGEGVGKCVEKGDRGNKRGREDQEEGEER